jgi:NAD(P)-dependent dehydrogenase (short-subunit alcohol dehydrogenase family)
VSEQSLALQDLFSVRDRVTLVTGGSRGIGLMIASGFVTNGAKVYITSRKKDVCDQVAKDLSGIGTCISLPADLSTTEGRAGLVDELKRRESRLDVLVNNAGAAWGAPIEEYPEDGWDKVMELNVKSVFMLTRDLIPLLEKSASQEDPARVINIGSIDALKVPTVDNFAYSPSKAAVHHMTRVLAVRLGDRHIAVNAVAPGPFESKMMAWTLENFREFIEAGCPRKRIGRPADMAGVALYLASPAGAYVNGAVIPVDGGIAVA